MSLSAVVQYKTAIAGPARQTIASTSPVAITGLSVTITPLYADSTILIRVHFCGNNNHVFSFGVFKDGAKTVSTSGYTNNNEADMQATTYMGYNNTGYCDSFPFMHYETSGDTTERTYTIRGTSGWGGTTYTSYANNRGSDDMASFCYMEVLEVKN